MGIMATDGGGNRSEVFWGEIAPCDHLLQIYPDDGVFLDTLEAFVAGGLEANEAVVVLATSEHVRALEDRLRARGIDLDAAAARDQYIAQEAARVLARFMVNDWPDEYLFDACVTSLLKRAGKGGRRVRAFGELVALLWRDGHAGATVRLEHLWHRLCHDRQFALFCAYPRIGFTQDADSSIREICATHSRLLAS